VIYQRYSASRAKLSSSIPEPETEQAGAVRQDVDGLLQLAIDIDKELLAGLKLVRLSPGFDAKMAGLLDETGQKIIKNAELLRQARLLLRT
jgi:hypothetical protein